MSLRSFGRRSASGLALALAAGLLAASCQSLGAGQPKGPAAVDGKRIANADKEPGEWMSHGRTYSEQRFSPLDQITTANVGQLGLAWYADLDTHRGQEATPIVVDGVIYVSTAWSKVKAYDAKTGAPIWSFDPEVPGQFAVNACCDVVNRGVAVWEGKVFVGTVDGRLIALDAATGKQLWSVVTVDQTKPYTITGAPRVVKGKVLIGNGGAEYGVRGYVTAYDADTGAQVWRFYTVPGAPGTTDGAASDKALAEKAQPTWFGDDYWKLGGGGTVWDSMSYDPGLDLLYIGVGNGSPWNRKFRSDNRGDNLFLTSIVALRPDTGEYVWHYQETNGESWDHTATQQMIIADLEIDGKKRHVLMQSPKNGFFYVLDAATGELISAAPVTELGWASGVDLATGRAIEKPEARYELTGKPFIATQNPNGVHTWHSMSYDPQTGLVYLPIHGQPFVFATQTELTPHELTTNQGVDFSQNAILDPKETFAKTFGRLIAWDPVAQKEVWRVERAGQANGGALSTAGGLVFQGTGSGELTALDAKTGRQLWAQPVQTGVVASPISYEVDGEQYVALMVGTGSSWAVVASDTNMKGFALPNVSRLLVYKLGGTAQLPEAPQFVRPPLNPPRNLSGRLIAQGAPLYETWCGTCHGGGAAGVGLLPDLRRSAFIQDKDAFANVVIGGALQQNGMASFAKVFDAGQAEAIRAYIISNANAAKAAGVK